MQVIDTVSDHPDVLDCPFRDVTTPPCLKIDEEDACVEVRRVAWDLAFTPALHPPSRLTIRDRRVGDGTQRTSLEWNRPQR